jgi:hypothetical protein
VSWILILFPISFMILFLIMNARDIVRVCWDISRYNRYIWKSQDRVEYH